MKLSYLLQLSSVLQLICKRYGHQLSIYWYGHVNLFDLEIYLKSWKPDTDPNISIQGYLPGDFDRIVDEIQSLELK